MRSLLQAARSCDQPAGGRVSVSTGRPSIRGMRHLSFPANEIVGTLSWLGARNEVDGPILATGMVDAPDDVEVSLTVRRVQSVERRPSSGGGFGRVTRGGEVVSESTSGESWIITGGEARPLHLGFLLELPRDSITDFVVLHAVVEAESLSALPHLAPGIKRLYLGWTDFEDRVLQHVAQLDHLVYLQTWGNRFTDGGVQQLGSLQTLETLYLEEENLSPAAFDFVARLPNLTRLGVAQEWSAENRSVLKARFPTLIR